MVEILDPSVAFERLFVPMFSFSRLFANLSAGNLIALSSICFYLLKDENVDHKDQFLKEFKSYDNLCHTVGGNIVIPEAYQEVESWNNFL